MLGLSGKTFQQYGTIYFRFTRAAQAAGIPGRGEPTPPQS